MALLGYGATLSITGIGTITGIQEITASGKKANVINVVTLDDTDQISENLKGAITEGPITCTIVFSKTVYDSLSGIMDDTTPVNITLTDSEGNVWTGDATLTGLSNVRFSPSGVQIFEIELTPQDYFAFDPTS